MITTHDREIQALVGDIKDGRLLLPELQRPYVWKAPQVSVLFDSLYRQYPSGQILVWQTDDLPHVRPPALDGTQAAGHMPHLLLDGQQRLTSLAAVMLGEPLKVRGSQRPIQIVFNVYTEKFEVAGPRQRGQPGWVSLTKFFLDGQVAILKDLKVDLSSEEAEIILEHLRTLEDIKKYRYRVNVLEKMSYAEVTEIFVRINSGGVKLGTADLALAQMSSRWRGVTQVFHKYQYKIWERKLWLDTGLLLRTMAVLLTEQSHLSQLFRGRSTHVTVEELQQVWKRAEPALNQAIDFLAQNCKIDYFGLLPSRNLLITMAAFFDRANGSVSVTEARNLQRWVYMALIWGRYSARLETNIDQDVAALRRTGSVEGMIENIEDTVGHNRLVTEREFQEQRKNSAYMLMAYVLARYNEAQDWFNGVGIGSHQALEFHHIFPKARLSDHYDLRGDSLTVDQVANLAFLSQKANARIAAQAPGDYLAAIPEERLRDQYVPLDRHLWAVDRFEDFARARRELLAGGINTLLNSLTDTPGFWTVPSAKQLEERVDIMERSLRRLIVDRLTAAWGDLAWEKGVPANLRKSPESRIEKQVAANPFDASSFTTLGTRLQKCQFSDYAAIIRANWPLFADTFGEHQDTFDGYVDAVIKIRNAIKHNDASALAAHSRAAAEAGLLWLEACLRRVETVENALDDEVAEDKEDP